MGMTRNDTTARQRREAWGSLRKLPSKRWQARYTGPDDKTYSARTEDDKPLTFLTKGDAREWLNGVQSDKMILSTSTNERCAEPFSDETAVGRLANRRKPISTIDLVNLPNL